MEVFEFFKISFNIYFIGSWMLFMLSFLFLIKTIVDQDDDYNIVISIIMIILSATLYFNSLYISHNVKISNSKRTVQIIEK